MSLYNFGNYTCKSIIFALITCLALSLGTCGGDSTGEPTTWNYIALGDRSSVKVAVTMYL
jgi:hypothetical protein